MSRFLVSALVMIGLSLGSLAQAQWGHGPSWPDRDEWGHGGSSSSRSYTLDMEGQAYRSGQRIRLKNELQNQISRIGNLDNARIESISIKAKSKFGRGSAELVIAGRSMDRKAVPDARRGTYEDNRTNSYNTVEFYVGRRQDQGAWSLQIDGNVKILSIDIQISRQGGGPGPGPGPFPGPRVEVMELGKLNIANPILPAISSFSVNEQMKSLKLKSENQAVQVLDVTIEYRNGNRVSMPAFQVFLFPGQEIEIDTTNRESVRRVHVTASSLGRDAKLKLTAKVQK